LNLSLNVGDQELPGEKDSALRKTIIKSSIITLTTIYRLYMFVKILMKPYAYKVGH